MADDWQDKLQAAREKGPPPAKPPVKPVEKPVEAPAGVRADIATALESWLAPEQLQLLMDEVLAITKSAPADIKCKSCGQAQRHMVQVPDARAVTSAIVELANQAWGRPGQADGSEAGPAVVVNYRVEVVEDGPEKT